MNEIKKIIDQSAESRPSKATRDFPELDNTGMDQSAFNPRPRPLTMEEIINQMADKWPSNCVARKAIREFSGGILSPKTCANEDSAGTGIEGRFLLMNQMCYPVESVIAWLKSRSAKSWQTRRKAA
jgi:hypothetical protein